MPLKIPTYEETRSFLMAFGRALFPFANYGSPHSWHGRKAGFLAAAVTELHAHVDSAQRDVHPLTAGDGKPVSDWGDAVGVIRKAATPARKSRAGRVSGSAASTVVPLAMLRHEASGLTFAVNQAVTIAGVAGVDPDGFVDADIVAIDVGAQTRLDAGETLKFVDTPVGIQTSVVLQLALDEGGYDTEQFGSYRNRMLATFSQAPSGGNQYDFCKWALESLAAVAYAYAYPHRAGRGTIDVVAFYEASGTSRSLSADDRAAVAAYIRTKAPFQIAGAGGGLRVLETIADPQRVELVLSADGLAVNAFDWVDSPPLVVGGWTSGTRELAVTTALPTSLRAGHRLILSGVTDPTSQDGREYKIESITQTFSPGKVVLEKAPVNAPVVGDLVYSGGPLVTPVRNAIVAHLDGQTVYAGRGRRPLPASAVASAIGLDVLAEGIGSANPGGFYGAWTGAILRASLSVIAMSKGGVRNVVVTTPVADYEAADDAFPLDGQIHYVTPGVVLVRSA